MAERWSEILEDRAEEQEKLRLVYRDIAATLRVRFVPWTFRVLAPQEELLGYVWRRLSPAITDQLETAADTLWHHAVNALAEAPHGRDHRAQLLGELGFSREQIPQLLDRLQVYRHVDPKLVVLFTALEQALAGRPGGVQSRVVWPTGRGVPPGMPRPERVNPQEATGAVASLFRTIEERLRLPTVPDEYRTLAHWPEYLKYAWTEIEALMDTDTYRKAVQEVEVRTVEALQQLRRRVEIAPEDLERWGISPDERAFLEERVTAIRRILPELTVQIAYLIAALGGPEEARLASDALLRRWTSPQLR